MTDSQLRALGTDVLDALAVVDLDAVRLLCAPSIVMYGTDAGERWDDLEALCGALEQMRSLGLSAVWRDPPAVGTNWVAGVAIYQSRGGPPVPTRVSLVFDGGRLVHGHFSIEGTMPVGDS